ncbi:MAG TPA: D-2-hydroxyacid dehydrogenase [Bryobacteraceae bacterium]|nr:D-2-hydroxyacid dehydrogenase [Bryobacteraceae bacterium]
MPRTKLVVISIADASNLALLKNLPDDVDVTIGSTENELAGVIGEADVLLNGMGGGDTFKALFPRAKAVKWIHSLSAGVENILTPELVSSPVPLTNARGVFAESLGEFVIAAALFFAKDLRRLVNSQSDRKWDQFDCEVLYRQSMAIVGYGEIGRAAAQRAKALGMKIYATRRRPELFKDDPIVDEGFAPEQRAEMLAKADYVVAASALTPESRGLIGATEIAAMKPTGVIMNVGRGPVIDEAALIAALAERRIRGAALDVFDKEPLPADHPFWTLDNVLLSPHTADHIEGWLDDATHFFLQNFARFANGESLKNIVDKRAGY